jgi:hypothetical protein
MTQSFTTYVPDSTAPPLQMTEILEDGVVQKNGEFLDQLSNYQLFKKDTAARC